MKTKSSLGSKILDAIYEALETPGSGRLVRPKVDVKSLSCTPGLDRNGPKLRENLQPQLC